MLDHTIKTRDFASEKMQLLDLVFYVIALVFVVAAVKAHNSMNADDIHAYRMHFTAAASLLVGMLIVLYLRSQGGVCAVMDRGMSFSSMFPNMRLRRSSRRRRTSRSN